MRFGSNSIKLKLKKRFGQQKFEEKRSSRPDREVFKESRSLQEDRNRMQTEDKELKFDVWTERRDLRNGRENLRK